MVNNQLEKAMKAENIIEIANVAVETDSMLTAIKVAQKAQKKGVQKGRVMVDGKYVKWWSLAFARRNYEKI